MGTNEYSQPASKSSWDGQDFSDVKMVVKMAHFHKSSRPQWVNQNTKSLTLMTTSFLKETCFDWNRYCFRLKFHKHCFLGVTIPSIGSGNGSGSIRRQSINWTNDGLGPASLKLFLTEFKFDENLILLSPKF